MNSQSGTLAHYGKKGMRWGVRNADDITKHKINARQIQRYLDKFSAL